MVPSVVGDISGNGRINAADASRVAQFAAIIDVPEIPPIPARVVVAGLVPIDLGRGLPGVFIVTADPLDRVASPPVYQSSSTHSGEFATAGNTGYPAVDLALTQLDISGALSDEEKLPIALEAAIEELLSAGQTAD